ncbi:hypothetical protein [Cronobacter malonaticus]|uniref:hypothetical protein n=1 Tax=Cronobacter malonaticus TaxID=413503 RepID=UPI0035170AE9
MTTKLARKRLRRPKRRQNAFLIKNNFSPRGIKKTGSSEAGFFVGETAIVTSCYTVI